jgi:hypothetical protein
MNGSHSTNLGRMKTLSVMLFLLCLTLPRVAVAVGVACSLLKAGDVAPLVGAAPVNKPSSTGVACSWSGAKPKHKVIVMTYKNVGAPADVAFMGARRGAETGGDAKVSDEARVGDKAFSVQASFGAAFVVLKHGKMVQLQYWTGAQGTAQDVDALRPVVRKAVAAF